MVNPTNIIFFLPKKSDNKPNGICIIALVKPQIPNVSPIRKGVDILYESAKTDRTGNIMNAPNIRKKYIKVIKITDFFSILVNIVQLQHMQSVEFMDIKNVIIA